MAPSPREIAVFSPLVIGVGVTTGTIVIHAVALTTIVHFVRHERRLGRVGVRFWRDLTIVTGTALLALAAHLIEITAWAGVFDLCREFPNFAPAETADGMLMFGVSTAMLFAVIQRLIQTRFRDADG
jgi:hypothetical protein